MVSTRCAGFALSLLLAACRPGMVWAQGYGIYEQGTCAMGRASTSVAEPCEDASAIYLSPGGFVGQKGWTIGVGGTLILADDSFTGDAGRRNSIEGGTSFVPHGYLRYGLTDKLAIGAGVYVPYGLGIKWPLDFEGRFISYDSTLRSIYVQPTIGYALTKNVSIGGGVAIVISSVELNRREDLANVPLGIGSLTFGAFVNSQSDFMDTSLSSSNATGVGAHVGATVKANDRLRFGVRYLSHVKLSYDLDAAFTPIGSGFVVTKPNPLGVPVGTPLDLFVTQVRAVLPNQSARTELDMPAQFVAGVSVHATPGLTLLGEYEWVGWSAFDEVALNFSAATTPDEAFPQSYRDTSAVRFRAETKVSEKLRVRAGYAYNQAAAPDETVTPLLPESQRNHVTVGVGWDLSRRVTLDVAYQYVHHADRRGRVVDAAPGQQPTVALNSGVYRARADLIGITLTFKQ